MDVGYGGAFRVVLLTTQPDQPQAQPQLTAPPTTAALACIVPLESRAVVAARLAEI
jgi:hypothetical protein